MVPVAAERRRRRAPVGNRHVRAVTAVDHHYRRIQPAHARDHRRRRERRRAVHVGPSLERHHRRRWSFVDRVRPTLERDVVVVARQPARPDPVRPRVGRHDHRWPIARRWLAGEVERQRPTQDARAFSVHEPAVAHVESRVRVAVGLGLVVRRHRQRGLVDVDEDVLRCVVEVPCIRRREINVQVLTRASVQHCPGRRVVGKGPGYRGVLERRCCVELRAVDGGAVRDVAGIRPVDRRCRLVHDQRAAASA